uniref:G-protein coupled receptors family 1 profile domain-containing protein n=1 Tax=Romanomermis culicivorax TaxID=13658 RepID=A0A915KHZ6_ROMCU
MNNGSINVSPLFNTLVTIKGLMPSLTFASIIHSFDSAGSLITLITLAKWLQMRSFSMTLICLMMVNEFLSASVQFSLDVWHIVNYYSGVSKSGFTGKQCSSITNIEIVVVVTAEVSAMIVSMDRLYSIVAPWKHDQLSKVAMFLAMIFPYLVGGFVTIMIILSSNAVRLTDQICSSTFVELDQSVIKMFQMIMTCATYSTIICYSKMLIVVYLKRRRCVFCNNNRRVEAAANDGSVENSRLKRYKKLNRVLAFSAVCYLLTASVANIVVYLVEDRFKSSMTVSSFFHVFLTMDGIVTFTSFFMFIPDSRKQLLCRI